MADESPERVVVERVLPASPAEVYAAWTTPETLRLFMCPGDMTAPVMSPGHMKRRSVSGVVQAA